MTRKHERPQLEAKGAVGDAVRQHHFTPSAPSEPSLISADLPPGVITIGDALREFVAMLPVLRESLERATKTKPPIERMALRFDEVAAALGVSRRLLERELSARRFVKPDVYIGRVPLWRVETVRAYLDLNQA